MELYRIFNELLGEHCRPQLCLLPFSGGRCKDVKATFFSECIVGSTHFSDESKTRVGPASNNAASDKETPAAPTLEERSRLSQSVLSPAAAAIQSSTHNFYWPGA